MSCEIVITYTVVDNESRQQLAECNCSCEGTYYQAILLEREILEFFNKINNFEEKDIEVKNEEIIESSRFEIMDLE